MIKYVEALATAAGGAGSAVGTAYSDDPICGEIIGVQLVNGGTPASTIDVTVSVVADGGQAELNLSVFTNNAQGFRRPQLQATDNTGAAITGAYANYVLSGRVKVVIAQGDANNTAKVRVYYRPV